MSLGDYFPMLKRFLPAGFQDPVVRHLGPTGKPVHGLLARYSAVDPVCDAAERVRDAGYTAWDMHSPFPMHGAQEIMGFKRTKLPFIAGITGLSGAGLGFLMQWWMSQNYEIVVQGKPPTAWQPFVPIMFEAGVLMTAFAALGSMMMLNGLPRLHHPLFTSEAFLSSSDDTFFVYIEARDARFDPQQTRALLESTSPDGIEVIEDA